jgi:DNA-directed RNA polymerase beta subunit
MVHIHTYEPSGMETYLPSLDAEELLINVLIPNVLTAISNRKGKRGRVVYTNVSIEKGMYKLHKVWNIHCDVEVIREDEHNNIICKSSTNVWLASIPRFNNNGLFELGKSYYHTVMRQRLVPNVPICFVKRHDGTVVTICRFRSENYETLESVSLSMYRQHRNNRSVMIETGAKGFKPINAIGYLRHHINNAEWIPVVRETFRLMNYSSTVTSLLELLFVNIEDTPLPAYLIPSTIDTYGEHYYVTFNDRVVSTEYIIICQMLGKFLAVESGESDADDVDDYCNKVVDNYANIMGKLFRKLVMKTGINITNISRSDTPKLYDKFIDAFTYNRWEVIDDYDSKLQVSRLIEHANPNCIEAALQEVITLGETHTSGDNMREVYNIRMIHPSQHGFVCIVRTSDDISAGLKLYLAADCRVTHQQYTFGVSSSNDNMRLRNMIKNTGDKIWIHNNHIVGISDEASIIDTLWSIKSTRSSVSWTVGATIESRDNYGRFMCRVILDDGICTLVDTREIKSLLHRVVVKPSNFSKICYEIPYMNMMPVARTMLAAKILQKCIPTHPPSNVNADYTQLTYTQKPLIRTSRSTDYCYGYNALVCYTTFKGMGIEDGIVLNKSSVERGLFMIIKRSSITWTKSNKSTVTEYMINVKIHTEIKEGAILAVITYHDDDNVPKIIKLKHNKPYNCKVVNIELTFDTVNSKSSGVIAPKYLIEISVSLLRCKRLRTGDKLSSRSAQKAVAVSIVDACDMPMIQDIHGDRSAPPTIDMIINPLSIISRCTVSQDVSSALGVLAVQQGASFVNHPFSHTEICYTTGSVTTSRPFDINTISGNRVNIIDGCTGLQHRGESVIGIEYYMVLNHIADDKTKSTSSTKRDDITGAIGKKGSDTNVRYNWQELAAMMHSKAYSLVSTIYNNTGDMGYYPYCRNCSRDVDGTNDNNCEYCGVTISTRVTVSRAFMTAKRLVQIMGSELSITGTDE